MSATSWLRRLSRSLLLRRRADVSASCLRGYFDAPTAGVLRRQPQLFYGWALDGDSGASNVELIFNRTTTIEADLGMQRPDVPLSLGEPNVAPACGWSTLIDLARWQEGDLEVTVMVSGRSGSRVALGSRSFRLEGIDLVGQVSALGDTAAAQQRALEGVAASLQGALEGLAASLQAAQQRALEGQAASLQGQIDALRAHQHNSTTETLFGMSLSAMRDVPMVAEPPALATTSGFAAIGFNYRVFRSLSWQAELRSRANDWPGVLTAARVAAEWASHNHPGVFSDPALDQAVAEAGRHLAAPRSCPPHPAAGHRRRVVHVLSQAFPVGGHTRLAERWMRFDTSSDHAVILTDQGGLVVPESLVAAATLRIHRVDDLAPAGRVPALRSLLADFDVVVLHIDPYDAVAVAACADPSGPPVLFVNHADHVYWLGVGVSDVVVNIRPSGAALSLGRRGVAPKRSVLLPLPLDRVQRARSRADAKRALGIGAEAPLMLTMARPLKYATADEPTFMSLVGEVLAGDPRSVLVAVGPDLETPGWLPLQSKFGERVIVGGIRTDTAPLLEAADIYLDSFPFASATALLETSLYGVPVVCFRPPGIGAMAFDDAAVEPAWFGTADEWAGGVRSLLDDEESRERLGAELAQRVGAAHFEEPWRHELERVYELARRAPIEVTGPLDPLVTPYDCALQRFHEASRASRPLESLLAVHGLLDWRLA